MENMHTHDNTIQNTFQSEVWLQKAKELYNLQQQRKNIESMEKELANQLKELQGNEPLSFGGIRYFYEERVGSVDYSAIPELKQIDLDRYRKPIVRVWKLIIENI